MNLTKIGANMLETVKADGTRILVSYVTPVAAFVPGTGYLRTETKWSQTTTRHINKWLNGAKAQEVSQHAINMLYNS